MRPTFSQGANMSNYILFNDNRNYTTRNIKLHVEQSAVQTVMDVLNVSERKAQNLIMDAYLDNASGADCVGLVIAKKDIGEWPNPIRRRYDIDPDESDDLIDIACPFFQIAI